MTLTWKIKYNDGSSFPYTYKIHVAGETNSINQTVNKTEAIIHGLSSSTLYNITVRPFLGHIEGTPGFLQVYTCKFTPWYLVWFAFSVVVVVNSVTRETWGEETVHFRLHG